MAIINNNTSEATIETRYKLICNDSSAIITEQLRNTLVECISHIRRNRNSSIGSETKIKEFEKYIETSPEIDQDERDALSQLSEEDRRELFRI
jgi:hypothetical protein